MKTAYIVLSLLAVALCGKKAESDGVPVTQYSDSMVTLSDVNIVDQKKNIVFTDGETLKVETNYYSDSVIDSIEIHQKSFKGIYQYCGKGVLNIDLFSCLKNRHNNEYQELHMITTAHSIKVNGNAFYFNGFKKVNRYPCQNTPVFINVKIFVLFSKGGHLCNILVINSIREDSTALSK